MASPLGGKIGTLAASRCLIRCPHCQAPSFIRSSDQVTETVKHLFNICTNPDCGHTWKSQISPIHTISPSHLPNPAVNIPPCPPEYIRQRHPVIKGGDPPDPDQINMFEDDFADA